MRGLPTVATWSCFFHFTILSVSMWAGCCSATGELSFEMKMIYKYSDEFREHMKGRPGMEHLVSSWPRHGTAEFYQELARHDQHRHRHTSRNLLTTDVVSLFPFNKTLYSRSMGGLHYSFILLGTPPQVFFVALDTGSDLLWVPCDCQQCSAANWASYDPGLQDLKFAIYSPSNSTTSKPVACNDVVCTNTLDPNVCDVTAPQPCTYAARYLSANTSSTGTIVQDVIYLNSETSGSNFTSEIYLGCGKLQTGDFLRGGAPNGLFGLGPEIYSVPTTFARNGITKNVFSMCFSEKDSSGRLVFGRKAGASSQSTPIVPIPVSIFYVLSIEAYVAAGVRVNVTHKVVFDTGTSFTILPSNIVKPLGDALSSASSLESFPFTSQTISFNYCWNITTNAELESLSSLSIVFSGGGLWTINDPLVRVVDDQTGNLLFVCLGILSTNSSSTPSIIGFNFMGNYEYFFDRETSTFSWSPSDCSGTNGTSTLAPSNSPDSVLQPLDSAPVPVPAPAPAKAATAPNSSQPPPPPPPSQFNNEASSISFRPMPLVFFISSTFFLLLSK